MPLTRSIPAALNLSTIYPENLGVNPGPPVPTYPVGSNPSNCKNGVLPICPSPVKSSIDPYCSNIYCSIYIFASLLCLILEGIAVCKLSTTESLTCCVKSFFTSATLSNIIFSSGRGEAYAP